MAKDSKTTKKTLSPPTSSHIYKTIMQPPPPPPPTPPRKMAAVRSVTRAQIDSFWRRKKMDEEEHLLAAQKAAARIRAKSLREDDYHRFRALLKEITIDDNNDNDNDNDKEEELQIGIKDWWTQSKYAYLNQPSIKSMDDKPLKQTCTYIPQKPCFNFWAAPLHPSGLSE